MVSFPPVLLDSGAFTEHDGIWVCDIGDDGDSIAPRHHEAGAAAAFVGCCSSTSTSARSRVGSTASSGCTGLTKPLRRWRSVRFGVPARGRDPDQVAA
jgi:hypothetical protein